MPSNGVEINLMIDPTANPSPFGTTILELSSCFFHDVSPRFAATSSSVASPDNDLNCETDLHADTVAAGQSLVCASLY